MTPEEILNKLPPNEEYPNYYHESNIISAMTEYASLITKEKDEEIVALKEGISNRDYDILHLQGLVKSQHDELSRYKEALEKIAKWELPATGKFWTDGQTTREYSYESLHGSNGARDYIKSIAQTALNKQP